MSIRPPVNWSRVTLDALQVGIGLGLMYAGFHGASFGDGATSAVGAILIGSGARGLAAE